jgi:anaerobic C4-dicarboxylate transporter DcuA
MLLLQLAILLLCIVIGARLGGIALGTVSGLGLVFFMVVLGMPPGNPPAVVLGMILAVITALSMMEAAGGMDYLVATAEKLLRKNPRRITVMAPLVTYCLIFAAGTQHVIYSLLPVIAEVSARAGVRPERPLSMSVIAAQHGLVASPVSAVTVALLAALVTLDVGLGQILLVTIPATLFGVAMGILSVLWRGRELSEDPLARLDPAEIAGVESPATATATATATAPAPAEAGNKGRGACLVFLGAVAVVVLFGLFPALRPAYDVVIDGKVSSTSVDMGRVIMIIMLGAAGLITLLFKASPAVAVQGKLMRGGLVAIISILGVSWLGSSFFSANEDTIVGTISDLIGSYPWIFALGLFVLSILLFSQAATIVILAPVGVALGMPASMLIGVYPAVNGNFFLPTYGTVLAAVSFDRTGTTRIGKYLLNHSFMVPGLVTTLSATFAALLLASVLL